MHAPFRTLIVDDEEIARRNLYKMLAPFSQQLTVIGEAHDGKDALAKINKLSPDLIFLDIHLPFFNAFEILHQLPHPLPRIIFVTAFDKYAIKAFEVNSIDYLLKPVNAERLVKAIARLTAAHAKAQPDLSLVHKAMEEIEKVKMRRIQVKIGNSISFVNLRDICYFQGENYLTGIYTADQKYLIDIPLYELEIRLPSAEFVRIHRSSIVNVSYVKELRRALGDKMRLIMKPPLNKELTMSRSYAKQLNSIFQCV